MLCFTELNTPVGRITLAAEEDALVGLWLQGQKYDRAALQGRETVRRGDLPVFAAAAEWLDAYFAGQRPEAGALPLRPQGSVFRQRVWRRLCRIPYGETITYGEIARQIAAETGVPSCSAQAVGGAVGHNPISILIPCHRVVGADGSLTGYAGGLDVKRRLLALEGVDLTRLYTPTRGTAL